MGTLKNISEELNDKTADIDEFCTTDIAAENTL
jgi:hypothetical protein